MRSFRVLPLLLATGIALTACDSPSPSTPPAVPPSPSISPSPSPSPSPAEPTISKAGFDHFMAVALGREYGSGDAVVTMWDKTDVTVRIHGGDKKSLACLDTVLEDFNALTATTDLTVTTGEPDIELHFAPVSKFRSIEPEYVDGNDGFFYFYWSDEYALTRATVLIRSTGIADRDRCHLIREEMTQVMGLAKDTDKYPESVFHSEWGPNPITYSALDREIIRLLYSGAVHPGDNRKAVTDAVTVTS